MSRVIFVRCMHFLPDVNRKSAGHHPRYLLFPLMYSGHHQAPKPVAVIHFVHSSSQDANAQECP
jgi:hypothetical protein